MRAAASWAGQVGLHHLPRRDLHLGTVARGEPSPIQDLQGLKPIGFVVLSARLKAVP